MMAWYRQKPPRQQISPSFGGGGRNGKVICSCLCSNSILSNSISIKFDSKLKYSYFLYDWLFVFRSSRGAFHSVDRCNGPHGADGYASVANSDRNPAVFLSNSSKQLSQAILYQSTPYRSKVETRWSNRNCPYKTYYDFKILIQPDQLIKHYLILKYLIRNLFLLYIKVCLESKIQVLYF